MLPVVDDAPATDAGPSSDDGGEDEAPVPDGGELEQDAANESDVDAAAEPDDAAALDAAEPMLDAAADSGGSDAGGDAAIADAAPDGAARDGAVADAGDAGSDAGTDSSLFLRYDFAGTGTLVRDQIGSAHAQAIGGAQLDGSGGLTLDGSNDYVDLPNGLLSNRVSVTMVAWLTWTGTGCWQRVFDFGSSDAGEGNAGDATSALSLTTASCAENVLTAFNEYEGDLRSVLGAAVARNTAIQLALVFDGATSNVSLYANGARVGRAASLIPLSQLRDVNNWLGRSQWIQDPYLRARFDEFRLYARALSDSELAALYTRGPDAP